MSTVEVVKKPIKEQVKEIADELCWSDCEANKRYDKQCARGWRNHDWAWDFSSTCNPRPPCWQCHKHDVLAERIAEEVGK